MHDQSAHRGIEGFVGGQEPGVREEALAGDFLVKAGLEYFRVSIWG